MKPSSTPPAPDLPADPVPPRSGTELERRQVERQNDLNTSADGLRAPRSSKLWDSGIEIAGPSRKS